VYFTKDGNQMAKEPSVARFGTLRSWRRASPRIHGELLKLGIDVGQTAVAKYMARGRRPPSQGWKTFLHNHADGIASMDLFVVPTISFRLLYGLLILQHDHFAPLRNSPLRANRLKRLSACSEV
jgi:hypothetical protein